MATDRLTDAAALALLEGGDLLELGAAADEVRRRLHPANEVTFIIDRNVNYTNFCVTDCDFCAFYRHPRQPEGYVLPETVIFRKIEETLALGRHGAAAAGRPSSGPAHRLYETCSARSRPATRSTCTRSRRPRSCTSPLLQRLTVAETSAGCARRASTRSRAAARRSWSIASQRRSSRPARPDGEWLRRHARGAPLGLSTTATMMYGTVETLDRARRAPAPPARAAGRDRRLHRVHLLDLPAGTRAQARPAGCHRPSTTCACWPSAGSTSTTSPNLQASWVTQGLRIGQLAPGVRRQRHGLDHDRGERRPGRRREPRGHGRRARAPRSPPPASRRSSATRSTARCGATRRPEPAQARPRHVLRSRGWPPAAPACACSRRPACARPVCPRRRPTVLPPRPKGNPLR